MDNNNSEKELDWAYIAKEMEVSIDTAKAFWEGVSQALNMIAEIIGEFGYPAHEWHKRERAEASRKRSERACILNDHSVGRGIRKRQTT